MKTEYTPSCEVKPGMVVPPGHRRIALLLEYNGNAFRGFQKQASAANTIQAHLEQALSTIADHTVNVVCAGRTDAGVHAVTQVVHFDTWAARPDKAWVDGTNTQLPRTVRVKQCIECEFDFHARFSARARTYRYLTLLERRPSAILHGLVTWQKFRLDEHAMAEAANFLVGEHDFSAFRSSQCQAKSPVRCIRAIRWQRAGNILMMEVEANAFLHHMVRNIMGSLYEVGRGARTSAWVKSVLIDGDRSRNAATAPAAGLYFAGVDYDAKFAIPSDPQGPPFLQAAIV